MGYTEGQVGENFRERRALIRAVALHVAIGAFAAGSARAGISLAMDPWGPPPTDVIARWEADVPGPFTLLRRELPVGTRPAEVLLDAGGRSQRVADRSADDLTDQGRESRPHVLRHGERRL